MKKIISILLIALVLVGTLTVPISAEEKTVIKGDSVSCEAGEQVSVALRVTENVGFYTLVVCISYDSEAMTLTSMSNKVSQFSLTKPKDEPYKSGNKYLWDSTREYTGTGEFVVLTFDVAEDAPTGCYDVSVVFVESVTIDGDDNIVDAPVTVSGAKIYVGVGESVTEETTEMITDQTTAETTEQITEAQTSGSGSGSGSGGGYTPPVIDDDTDLATEELSIESIEDETEILTETLTDIDSESATLIIEDTEITSDTDSVVTTEANTNIVTEIPTEVASDSEEATETESMDEDGTSEIATNETDSLSNTEERTETVSIEIASEEDLESDTETEYVVGSCGSFVSGFGILLLAMPVVLFLTYRKDKK